MQAAVADEGVAVDYAFGDARLLRRVRSRRCEERYRYEQGEGDSAEHV